MQHVQYQVIIFASLPVPCFCFVVLFRRPFSITIYKLTLSIPPIVFVLLLLQKLEQLNERSQFRGGGGIVDTFEKHFRTRRHSTNNNERSNSSRSCTQRCRARLRRRHSWFYGLFICGTKGVLTNCSLCSFLL